MEKCIGGASVTPVYAKKKTLRLVVLHHFKDLGIRLKINVNYVALKQLKKVK
jgi:hypothetical protein